MGNHGSYSDCLLFRHVLAATWKQCRLPTREDAAAILPPEPPLPRVLHADEAVACRALSKDTEGAVAAVGSRCSSR